MSFGTLRPSHIKFEHWTIDVLSSISNCLDKIIDSTEVTGSRFVAVINS